MPFFLAPVLQTVLCGNHNEMNAIAKRKMLAASKKVFLLADHSKFERKDLIQLCDLSTIHHLFTNRSPPDSIQMLCRQHQINITI